MIKKLVISAYVGIVVYCLISLFSGPVGFNNMKALNYFKTNLEQHVENLDLKGQKLNDEIERLKNDNERLTIASRPLGYVELDEKMIKILNNKVSKSLYDIDPQYIIPHFKDNTVRILLVSALFAVIIFVLTMFFDVLKATLRKN